MAILAYGINYRTAPVEVRERIAFAEESVQKALSAVRGDIPGVSEAAIISTCNRTELYCRLDGQDQRVVPEWLAQYKPVSQSELQSMAYSYWDQDAAKHIIRVAAGLDSQVLGEPQIMGQVKTAYDIARQAGALGPELNLLSQISLATAKRVRTETGIGRNPVSVAYAAVTLARQIFTDLSSKKALLLGAGDTIGLVAEHLVKSGIGGLAIANRTLFNAEALAHRFQGTVDAQAMQLTDVANRLHEYDVVIGSTGSTLPVLGKGAVEAAIRQRKRKPIFMVDIAVPRDIEPEVSELPDVYLYTIDDLTSIIDQNKKRRHTAAADAETLVSAGAQQYIRERRAHEGQALLRNYRDGAEAIQQQALADAQKALAGGENPEKVIADLSRMLTNKLIHKPTVAIRNASADGRSDLLEYLRTLYQLD